MNAISKLINAAKTIDRIVWPSHRITLSEGVLAKIKQEKLVIADVGSADGPEERWLRLNSIIRFITFEPNPRTDVGGQDNVINFPIGLWSKKETKPLYITSHPDSSSLYKLNNEVFCDFLIQEGSQVVDQLSLELDTLDACLGGNQSLKPHFLKVDVEGGDLEVMRGAEDAVCSTVLGIRTEATLLPLWIDAPQLWDVSRYLAERGFSLFNLGKVHWVRNNALYGYTSQPQLIWGDAVYFITKNEFLKRIESMNSKDKEILLIRFIIILLAHGCHDYAIEIVDSARKRGLVDEVICAECRQSINRSVDQSLLIIVWYFAGVLFAAGVFLLFCAIKSTRNHAKFYLKQRVGRFSQSLLRWAGKAGRPYGASFEDQFD